MRIRSYLAAAALLAASTLSVTQAAVVVVPNANAGTLGGGGITPGPLPANYGTAGQRFQEVYDAGQFGAFGTSESINQIAFRARTNQFAFAIGNSVTVSNVIIKLSTTSKSADFNSANYISNQFADNVGADVTTVYSGPLTLTSTQAPGSTAIDYVVNLSSLFNYQKSLGNLLLDVTVPDGATTSGPGSIGYAPFDFATDNLVTSDGVATAFGTGSTTTIGANSTAGVVTRFTSVPEPTGVALIAGVAALGARRRKGVRVRFQQG